MLPPAIREWMGDFQDVALGMDMPLFMRKVPIESAPKAFELALDCEGLALVKDCYV